MRLVVIGGGQFGTYHARQLLRAGYGGAVTVVDRDPDCLAFRSLEVEAEVSEWLPFLRSWLGEEVGDDQLVPAPLAPHLLWEWLGGALQGSVFEPPPRGWGLPYEVAGAGLELYLSAAAWRCPATCIEPAHCPALHGPRNWDLADLIEEEASRLGLLPAVFRCLHFAGGVGTISAAALVQARDRLREAPSGRALIATSSRCHAAVGALRLAANR